MDILIGLFRLIEWIIRKTLFVIWWILGMPYRIHRRDARRGGTHGSSRWATRLEQLWYGAIRGDGVVLGRGAFRRFVRFSKDGLVMVFAQTGAGKGLGVVIPSLLSYRGSMLVTDPKGENYAITRRRRALMGEVRMLNPSDLSRSERFNPMDIIRKGTPNEADDAAGLANLMVKPDAREAHWDDKATSLLKALILHALHEPPETRTLAAVRMLSVGSKETFLATLEEISEDSPSLAAREIASGILTSAKDANGGFSSEFTSILSNVQKATEPWSAGSPAGILSSTSTFRLSELTETVSTLFLCVDEELLGVYDRWLRVMVGCTLKTLTRAKANPPKRKVVLLLDEVAVLGKLDPLESQSGLLRAYCTPVLIWQSLPQIQNVYGKAADAFLANASARVFFGTNDNATAHYVATMLGNTTTLSSSSGVSQSSEAWLERNRQEGQAESGYFLLDPAEVQRLPTTRAVIKMRHVPFPILAKRIDYRKIWRWRGKWDKWMGTPPQGTIRPPAAVLSPTKDTPAPPTPPQQPVREPEIAARVSS